MEIALLPRPEEPLVPVLAFVSVLEALERRRADAPTHLAVSDGIREWSYEQLGANVGKLARVLRENGVGPGDVVAIHADRNALVVVGLLAVLKVGAAFAVIPIEYPVARRRNMLSVCGARTLLDTASAPLADDLRGAVKTCISLVDGAALGGASDASAALAAPDAPAYVTFTSGTTGGPKAIVSREAPLAHFLEWERTTFAIGPNDRFSALSGIAHDPFLRDVLTPLVSGGSVWLPDQTVRLEPDALVEWLADREITVCHLTPSLGEILALARPSEPLRALRWLVFGGEPLRGELVERLRPLAPSARIVNFYGTTETPQAMGWFVVDAPRSGPVPVGRGIDGVQLLVLDASDRLTAVDEVGEVCVRTPYLAEGYLDRRPGGFGINPFTRQPSDRMYRTGDRGRYLPDGNVELLGRGDDQVKVRGFRVELAEIENAVRANAGVRQAAVVLRPDTKQVVAYVVGEVAGTALMDALRKQLPDYMVPNAIVVLDALPLTPNGKVDRQALPAPKRSSIAPPPPAGERAMTPTEEKVAAVWKEVLCLDDIGTHDQFFDVGGHSLNATTIGARLRDLFDIDLPVRTIFERPTIAELAARVDELARSGPSELRAPPITLRPIPPGSLLTFEQEAILSWHRRHPKAYAHVTTFKLDLRGPVDVEALVQAVRSLLERQETLRQIVRAQGKPGVCAVSDPTVEFVDMRGKSQADIERYVLEHNLAPFDVDGEPLVRFHVIREGDDAYALHIAWHRIAQHGTGHDLFVQEILEFYGSIVEKRPPNLPPLKYRYVDYAAWQRSWFLKGKGKEIAAAAHKRLEGAKPLEVPTDRPRSGPVLSKPVISRYLIDNEGCSRFLRLCTSAKTTPFAGAVALVTGILGRWAGTDEVTVTTPVSFKPDENAMILAGRFGTEVPLRMDTSGGDLRFGELLARAHAEVNAAMEYSSVPAKLVFETSDPFEGPYGRVVVNMPQIDLGASKNQWTVAGVEARMANVLYKPDETRSELLIRTPIVGGKIVGSVLGAETLFDASSVARLSKRIERGLREATLETRIDDLLVDA